MPSQDNAKTARQSLPNQNRFLPPNGHLSLNLRYLVYCFSQNPEEEGNQIKMETNGPISQRGTNHTQTQETRMRILQSPK
ncbi:hypothetical protein TNCV_604321 [Trichonephila clavipes]|nr:hypothetical protein TNCV_604321 [Trichonephila clavipes]